MIKLILFTALCLATLVAEAQSTMFLTPTVYHTDGNLKVTDEDFEVRWEKRQVYDHINGSDTLFKSTSVDYTSNPSTLAGMKLSSIQPSKWGIIVTGKYSYQATAEIWRGPTDGLKKTITLSYHKGVLVSVSIKSYKEEWVTETTYSTY